MLSNSLSIFCGFFLIGVASAAFALKEILPLFLFAHAIPLFILWLLFRIPFAGGVLKSLELWLGKSFVYAGFLLIATVVFCTVVGLGFSLYNQVHARASVPLGAVIALLWGCTPPPDLFLLISFSSHRSWAVQGFWSGFLLVVFGCQDSPLEWLAGAYPHRFWLLSPLSALPDPPDAVSSLRFSIWDRDCWFLLFARPPELALPPWLSPLSAPFLGFPLLLLPLSVVYGVSDYSFSWQVRRRAVVTVARDMEARVRPQPRLVAPIFSPKSAERISLFDQGSKVFSDRSWTTSAVCWAKSPKYGPDLCLSIYFNGLLPAPIGSLLAHPLCRPLSAFCSSDWSTSVFAEPFVTRTSSCTWESSSIFWAWQRSDYTHCTGYGYLNESSHFGSSILFSSAIATVLYFLLSSEIVLPLLNFFCLYLFITSLSSMDPGLLSSMESLHFTETESEAIISEPVFQEEEDSKWWLVGSVISLKPVQGDYVARVFRSVWKTKNVSEITELSQNFFLIKPTSAEAHTMILNRRPWVLDDDLFSIVAYNPAWRVADFEFTRMPRPGPRKRQGVEYFPTPVATGLAPESPAPATEFSSPPQSELHPSTPGMESTGVPADSSSMPAAPPCSSRPSNTVAPDAPLHTVNDEEQGPIAATDPSQKVETSSERCDAVVADSVAAPLVPVVSAAALLHKVAVSLEKGTAASSSVCPSADSTRTPKDAAGLCSTPLPPAVSTQPVLPPISCPLDSSCKATEGPTRSTKRTIQGKYEVCCPILPKR
ncbi:hypothetical protein V6N11_025439 [Hibiscus sabdariffa]|uniref:DUF4283 domain-containing protein n=1 Tax=Hibiscus sabdariffa TaxID=183260 RepID=A0ABR2N9U9_9ROSI